MYARRFVEAQTLCPLIKALGQSRQTRVRPGLALHQHGLYEICLITGGTVDWVVEGRHWRLAPDSIFVTRPGEVHGSPLGQIQPCELTWIQVRPAAVESPDLAALFADPARRVATGARPLVDLVLAMLDECEQPRPESPTIVRGLLGVFLGRVVRAYQQAPQTSAAWRYLDRALAHAAAHPVPWPSVDGLAAAAGISRSRLHGLFLERYAQTPGRYLMQLRLQLAQRRLLDEDRSITEIALALGFSSSQHFATAFRTHLGMSPSDYRRRNYL